MRILEYDGKKLELNRPAVMGILNVTPDSFYDGGRYPDVASQVRRAAEMLEEGADLIDIGGASTRPGAADTEEEEELLRVMPALQAILREFPACRVSVDTCRSAIARIAADNGAFMINDISGGVYDPEMIPLIARLNIPYVLMHMKGTPADMQEDPQYADVVAEISYFFDVQLRKLDALGFHKLVLDPGFGFGKTPAHNFEILDRFEELASLGYPLMAGFSRKSMVYRTLGVDAGNALNGTTVLNTIALMKGVNLLRVHDVREAVEAVRLTARLNDTEFA